MRDPDPLLLISTHRLFAECMASALAARHGLGDVWVRTPDDLTAEATLADGILIVDLQREPDAVLDRLEALRPRLSAPRLVLIADPESIEPLARGFALRPTALVAGETSVEELADVIDRVRKGETHCCARLGYRMSRHLAALGRDRRRADLADAHRLSARELEVLQLIADGLDNRTIADRLCLSIYTVKNHVHSILDKLDVASRTEAAAIGYRRQWLRDRRRAAR